MLGRIHRAIAKRPVVSAMTVVVGAAVNVATGVLTQRWQWVWLAVTVGLVLLGGILQARLTGSEGSSGGARGGIAKAAKRLANEVRHQLEAETGSRSVWRPEPIPVMWEPLGQPYGVAEYNADLVSYFRNLPSRQLVVLGEAGAGKTVMAMLLVLGLLADRHPDEPVPVLFSLSSWDRVGALGEWLARQLRKDYPFLADSRLFDRDIAERLINERKVMPVLDGLDEMPRHLVADAIEAIEEAVAGDAPLVVTSRASEYEAELARSGSHFTRATVVVLKPVDLESGMAYLAGPEISGDDRWQQVFREVRADLLSPLRPALTKPLTLYLLRTVYKRPTTAPKELLDTRRFPDAQRIEEHLLGELITAVYDRPYRERYTAEQANRWLRFLAKRMRGLGTAELSWWKIRSPVAFCVVAALFALGGWWIFYPDWGWIGGIAGAVVLGGIGGGLSWSSETLLKLESPKRTTPGSRSSLRQSRAVAALLTGLVGATVGGLFGLWFMTEPDSPTHNVASVTATFAVVFGFGTLFSTAWGTFLLSRLWLTGRRKLPLRLITFIDNAHRKGILRQVGSTYLFRHIQLRDRMAALTADEAPARQPRDPTRAVTVLTFVRALSLRLGIQIGAVLFVALGLFYVMEPTGIGYSSGYQPSNLGFHFADVPVTDYLWDVGPGANLTTTMSVSTSGVRLPYKLAGGFHLDRCQSALVEITLAGRGIPRQAIRIDSRSDTRLGAQFTTLVPSSTREISLTFRRLDPASCRAQVKWESAGAFHQRLFRLHPPPGLLP
jgi:hypothetical protein